MPAPIRTSSSRQGNTYAGGGGPDRSGTQRSLQIPRIDPSTIDTSGGFGPALPQEVIDALPNARVEVPGSRRIKPGEPKYLRYPKNTENQNRDYLEIRVVNYKPIGNDQSRYVSSPGSRKNTKQSFRTIHLPIPSNVQDGNSVSYEDSNLSGLVAAAAGGAQQLMNLDMGKLGSESGRVDLINQLSSIFSQGVSAAGGAGVAGDLVNKLLLSQAVGVLGGSVTINQLLAREQGVIFNPNMELLFNGPTLRQFRFSFKFTPRESGEAVMVKQIIREFKQRMAPKIVGEGPAQNLFLRTPDIFELEYKTGTGSHPFLHKFKQCALTDMSVNYTGEGTYATYGAPEYSPVSMVMDLTFKELEPVYDIDYIDSNGNAIDNTVGY
jgi:hypothetical protein